MFAVRSLNRWIKIVRVILVACMTSVVMAADPVVSNVRAAQRTGTGLFEITYDLADADTTHLTVTVAISTNNGATWFTVASSNLTGAAGAGAVSPGTGKIVVWQGSRELPLRLYPLVKARITADDTQPPPPGMVLIPAGINSGTDPEYGAYSLTNVVAFCMGATEVTKAKWDEVYAWAMANGYGFDEVGSGKELSHPVQGVNWFDCVKWCNASSVKEGRTPCYTYSGSVYKTGRNTPACNFSANGYRLPTKTEWVYAARGGLNGKRFPWGDTITHSQANYYSVSFLNYDVSPTRGFHPTYSTGGISGEPYTSPVGSFAANGYGLFDMAGNVFEWCWDATDTFRYFLGGSWYQRASGALCGSPTANSPSYGSSDRGFRAVCR